MLKKGALLWEDAEATENLRARLNTWRKERREKSDGINKKVAREVYELREEREGTPARRGK